MALRHGKATALRLKLTESPSGLMLEIEDNGIGMDISQMGSETHGLTGMRHRVQAIGGQLEIVSKPGNGVFTRALLPLESKVIASSVGIQNIKIKTPNA